MKLSLTLTERRRVDIGGLMQHRVSTEYEDVQRIQFADFDAPAAVLASVLRGIADDIDPRLALAETGEMQP